MAAGTLLHHGAYPRPARQQARLIGFPHCSVSDDTGKRVVPAVAAVVALLALGYLILPFEGGGKVDCRALFGDAKPTRSADVHPITGREAKACRDAGMSRGITAGFLALLALVAAGAAVLLPPEDERDWPASWFGVPPANRR